MEWLRDLVRFTKRTLTNEGGYVGAIIAGVGAIAGGAAGMAGANTAASQAGTASGLSIMAQAVMTKKIWERYQPFTDAGINALDEIATMTPDQLIGGAQKYIDQLENLDIKLDENDPIYKWRKEQTDKAVNQALAARGIFDSRAGVNALAEANQNLQGEEVNRQYTAQYGKLMDLINLSMKSGALNYGRLSDLAKMGLGSTGGSAEAGISAANSISSNFLASGAQQANATMAGSSLLASAPLNALATAAYGKSSGLFK
jgi:hypothetical protein